MALHAQTMNYTLGRGELYFGRFKPGTQTPEGERYFGNTPEFTLTFESEDLDHFSSERGIREKDDSIVLEVTRSGTITCDHIDPENIALFFFGSSELLTDAGGLVEGEEIAAVMQGRYYQLGVSAENPAGVRGLVAYDPGGGEVNIVVTDGDSTTYTEGTDYNVDMDLARIYIIPDGAISDNSTIEVDYTVGAHSRTQVFSGSMAVEGSLRFIAHNPKGEDFDYFMPWVKVTPNGDYALKGEEWQTIPWTIEVLKKPGLEALYVDGRPFATS